MAGPVYIAGSTAVGKTAIAIEVAREIGGEIVSVDSMQVYRLMNIGTAKPTTAERTDIPHHLIDVVDPSDSFDAATFVDHAKLATERIKRPILCGGTGLYFRAWLEGLGEAPGADDSLREELETMDTSALLAELCEKDPATHQVIDHHNRRRLVRAVEVIRLTGEAFSTQRAEWKGKAPTNFFLIQREPGDLRQRIEVRVDKMFKGGLVEETRDILSTFEQNRTAQQALGYKQVIDHLRGERDLPTTIALVKSRTWQYARRQRTWFRKMSGTIRLDVETGEPSADTARRIIDFLT